MHVLRINTSDHSKIVINSPEVQLYIKRPHAKVGNKSTIISSYKNHLDRFCINGKQFIEKDLHHNFVQCLVHDLVITKHKTYPKNRYRGLRDFEIS
jgi:hypothetical protein